MSILVFDTETTGKADFKQPPSHPNQPHIVQLGAILMDDKGAVRGEINLIIKPNGWTIPDEVAEIHGITKDIADQFGVEQWLALRAFDQLAKRAKVYVAHNFQFDFLMVRAACHLEEADFDFKTNLDYIGKSSFCTMQATTPICQLPGKYDDYKWPKLQEAYKHAFGQEFEGAHDAMADVRACARLYLWLKERSELPV
jgi:DNA polymerase III subunit epsilon